MIVSHGQTDIGRRRKINEDSIFAAGALFIVCDGMGGHKAGEVASSLAVEAMARFIERSDEDHELTWPFGFDPRLSYNANRVRTAMKLANRSVFRKASSDEEYVGMGTTAVVALFAPKDPVMTYAGVGDSRIYLLRAGGMLQLTHDDSLASVAWAGPPAEEVGATGSALRNILTKALGAREDVEFDVVDHALAEGDLVLLCSDGLTGMLPDARILEIATAHGGDLAGATRALVAEANAAGGRDNISVVLAQYRR
ncbi:MAG: serine/threonine-protein phosphatase [Candidatus Rokubacteria bacterium]|nr:serine/threonine-protein phosphatase [Candidatus Rokubacteria bacterium]